MQENVEKEEKRLNKEEKEAENIRGGEDGMGRKIYRGGNGKGGGGEEWCQKL